MTWVEMAKISTYKLKKLYKETDNLSIKKDIKFYLKVERDINIK